MPLVSFFSGLSDVPSLLTTSSGPPASASDQRKTATTQAGIKFQECDPSALGPARQSLRVKVADWPVFGPESPGLLGAGVAHLLAEFNLAGLYEIPPCVEVVVGSEMQHRVVHVSRAGGDIGATREREIQFARRAIKLLRHHLRLVAREAVMGQHQPAAVQMIRGEHLLPARFGEVLEEHGASGDQLKSAVSLAAAALDIPIADQGLQARKGRSRIHIGIGSGPSGNACGDGRGQKQARNRKQTMVFHTVPPASGTWCPFGPRRSDALDALNRHWQPQKLTISS